MALSNEFNDPGLTDEEVLESRRLYGRNEVEKEEHGYLSQLKEIATEPMVLLLLVGALLYLISGETGDAIFMAVAIFLVTGISFYQENRSKKALSALRSLTDPACQVIRNGRTERIPREDIVIGDHMVLSEGVSVPADGVIIHSNDFSLNESILTGESLPVEKNKSLDDNKVFQGTTVVGGLAICRVTAIGENTALGKIGKSLQKVHEEDTPLQHQIRNFVKKMAFVGIVIFVLVWLINYVDSRSFQDSLLKALTLAMSILPEEIPVAFTTFMALGAWRLAKLGVIVKHIATVESLGSATVICTDKTGTLTENRMSLTKVYSFQSGSITGPDKGDGVIRAAMWASEPIPFDPMEQSLHDAYAKYAPADERPDYRMVHEYPLGGTPPMMTHVHENSSGLRIIAAKGAPEAILGLVSMSPEERVNAEDALAALANEGYRVLGVAVSNFEGNDFPKSQQELPFAFLGFVAFYDPPKKNIPDVLNAFYDAGIKVKIITGDNPVTTATIARRIGLRGADPAITGEELVGMSDDEMRETVKDVNVFTRMFPEAKLKILNALKANGEVVAMTGDGVNDGPALKGAHIGIAMGQKGSEVAKEVSSLIITDDDLSRMVDAISMGRKIYSNLKKAIQYIISIHIPIILTVFIPLVLGWVYPAIFSPVHVIVLELIMGPTCSIIYENEPLEGNLMRQKPRPFKTTFFDIHELGTSIVQGLVITSATLFVYQLSVANGASEDATRTMVFTCLISANIFLTLVNRSFYYSVFSTIRYKNALVPLIIIATILLTALIILFKPLRNLFEFDVIDNRQFILAAGCGAVSVLWYELVKAYKRVTGKPAQPDSQS
jgi:Ca2+-transporting ATPase